MGSRLIVVDFPAVTPNGEIHLNGGVPRKILVRVFCTIMLGESRPVKCVVSVLWADISVRKKCCDFSPFIAEMSRTKLFEHFVTRRLMSD